MKDSELEQKVNFLLEVRSAVKRNQVVIMNLYSSELDDYFVMTNAYGIDFNEVFNSFSEMPFLGRIKVEDVFNNWKEYYDDLAMAEIYGFELEDGMVQISILDYYVEPTNRHDEK